MYLIVTYGREDMRGVQVRGIRIANCFDRSQSIFINDGDSSLIKKEGYNTVDINLNRIQSEETIDRIIKENKIKKVIFADLPTNRLSQIMILKCANKNRLPVIVFENYYAKRQFSERIYQNTLAYCDLMFVNGLSSMPKINIGKVERIPPFIVKPDKSQVFNMKKKLQIKEGSLVITAIAYNEKVIEIVKRVLREYNFEDKVTFIVSGQQKNDIVVDDNIVKTPFFNYKEFSALLSLSDIVIGKMGYLQFLEALSLKKIFISVGTEKGFKKYWLENRLKPFCIHFDDYDKTLVGFLKDVITDGQKRSSLQRSIASLHGDEFFNELAIRQRIEKTVYQQKITNKVVLLYYFQGDLKELQRVKKIIESIDFVLPLIFYRNKGGLSPDLKELLTLQDGAIIQSSLSLIFNLSGDSFHSIAQVFPWYTDFLKGINMLLTTSDEIVVFGEQTRKIFRSMIATLSEKKVRFLS